MQFSKTLVESVSCATENYWEQEINIALEAINNFRELRDEYLVKDFNFFSSKIKVKNNKDIIIRLSKTFILEFLDSALSSNIEEFKLQNLTELEIKILNNFCEFLYKKMNEILIPEKEVKSAENNDDLVNFIFLAGLTNKKSGHIILSIPQNRIKAVPIVKKDSFEDEDFLNLTAQVKILLGKTKVTLDELKSLSLDDIVLLEDSNINKLTLISGNLEKKFNVKPNPSLIFSINEDDEVQENNNKEVIMNKNLWDDIQIEISAEFEKVKMTIGELKQITKGQIVDLGSIFNNEISLFVENKKVAKGELIIINDKYAVKLNEVLSSNPKPATENIKQETQQAPQIKEIQNKPINQKISKPLPKPQVQPKQQKPVEEEFDYSDFEK